MISDTAMWVAAGVIALIAALLAGLMPDVDDRDVDGRRSSLDG